MAALPKPQERRAGPRVALDAAAIIRLDNVEDGDVRSRIIDASATGLKIAIPAPRPVGTKMHICVRIGDPAYEISVTGIIVHVQQNMDAPPGFTTHVGIYLVEAGPDWAALCRRLVHQDAPAA
jgi:hypothetical protein